MTGPSYLLILQQLVQSLHAGLGTGADARPPANIPQPASPSRQVMEPLVGQITPRCMVCQVPVRVLLEGSSSTQCLLLPPKTLCALLMLEILHNGRLES
jgi:hypothetical protein